MAKDRGRASRYSSTPNGEISSVMVLMTRLQFLTLAAGVATFGVGHYLLASEVPPERWLLSVAIAVIYHLWWAGSIILLHWRRHVRGKRPEDWYHHSEVTFWFGNLTTVACFWLLMPFAEDAIRLLIIIFCMGPVAIEVVGTIRSPEKGPPGLATIWVPFVIPAGVIAYLLFHPTFLNFAIALYLVAFSAIMWRLRKFIQHSVHKAYLAMKEVERLNQERSRFLASAAHDFGQPLQAARLFFDQAMAHSEPAKRKKAIRNAEWAFEAMARLIDNLNDHLQLREGVLVPSCDAVPLGPLLAKVVAQHRPFAESQSVALRLVPTSVEVIGDPALLARCLSNLLGNALTHAKAKRVLIGCRRRGQAIQVYCIDDGGGIAAEDRDQLFAYYTRGSDHGDETRGGYGLGLAGTRAMARLMGGDAGHDPRWQKGSAFWLEAQATGMIDH